MARPSNPPAENPPTAPKHLRPELEALVRTLAALPDDERTRVYDAVNDHSRQGKPATLSWDKWETVRGVVSLGGNAVDDCDQLYDDA